MKIPSTILAVGLLATVGFADGREPGSLLIYTMHRSGLPGGGASTNYFTVLNVTNTNLDLSPVPGGIKAGDTDVLYEYLNVIPDPNNPFEPLSCFVVDRTERLTPGDTLSVLTTCHNAGGNQEGYVVLTATDPQSFKTPWAFNHLIGSEMVVSGSGALYSLNAIPFNSMLPERAPTDLDQDSQRDFDGAEYEGIPDLLYIDNFLAIAGSSLTLLNLTGGTDFVATVAIDAWNDNEIPLSAVVSFKCWFEEELKDVSLIFSEAFLSLNTPHDPNELDVDCDGIGDLEAGWAVLDGIVANSNVQAILDPAILGAVTTGPNPVLFFDGGNLLWESPNNQFNGDFLNYGGFNPEE